jgi:hypothetical protein
VKKTEPLCRVLADPRFIPDNGSLADIGNVVIVYLGISGEINGVEINV